MAAPAPGSRPASASGIIPAEWPAQAADAIVDTIEKVRDKTTRPVVIAARGLVYGVIAVIVGTVAAILLLVGITRFLTNWMEVWVVYTVLALGFSLGGAVLLRKANAVRPADTD
jgi:hypothetical protein